MTLLVTTLICGCSTNQRQIYHCVIRRLLYTTMCLF